MVLSYPYRRFSHGCGLEPTKDEVARSEIARLAFLILLKTFQRLGYFVQLRDVPQTIVEHIAHTQTFPLKAYSRLDPAGH